MEACVGEEGLCVVGSFLFDVFEFVFEWFPAVGELGAGG
mgnify:FL=1